MTTELAEPSDPRISGSKLVAAMFAMAITATSILWFYWDLHLQPFMPLQEAIASEYEKSSPRVDGGQRKSHKGTPRVRRVVIRVPFDPNSDDGDVQSEVEGRISRIRELAAKYASIEDYELLDVHMFQENKEKVISQKTFEKDISDTAVPRI